MHKLDKQGAGSVHLTGSGNVRVINLHVGREEVIDAGHPLTEETRDVEFVPYGRAEQLDAWERKEGSRCGFPRQDKEESGRKTIRSSEVTLGRHRLVDSKPPQL